MKFHTSLRNLWSDIFPAIFIVIYGMMFGIAFALGRFDPDGPLQTLFAWVCLIYTPAVIFVLIRVLARPALLVDEQGIAWRLINNESGYFNRDEVLQIAVERADRVTMLRVITRSNDLRSIPIQTRREVSGIEAEVRAILEVDE